MASAVVFGAPELRSTGAIPQEFPCKPVLTLL